MAAFNRFNSFLEAAFEKVHNLGSDSFVLALCATASAPIASNTQLSNLTTVSYTNLSSRALTISSSSNSSGTYKWVLADITLSASGGSVAAFQYVVIYNDTATNDELVGWYDYGSALTLASGESLTVDFDGTNGVFTVG
jgi:hypothetical protein